MQRHRGGTRQAEQGSIPLALLTLIMISALIMVLINNVISSQRQVVFDRDFAEALPVADAGVEVAQYLLNSDDGQFTTPSGTFNRFDFPVGQTTIPETRELNGQTTTWTITRLSEVRWEAESFAEINGTTRRVVGVIEEEPSLTMAAFTERLLRFAGANAADSYTSQQVVAPAPTWCTGNGIVGSNDELDFEGGSGSGSHCTRPSGVGQNRTVDRVDLYGWDDNPGVVTTTVRPGGDRCAKNQNHANCRDMSGAVGVFPAPRLFDERLDLATDDEIAFISEAIDACKTAGPLASYRTSVNGAVLNPAPNATQAALVGDMRLAGGHYCYESLNFDANTRLAPSASIDNPVIIFVEKDVIIRGQGGGPGAAANVGCKQTGCGTGTWADPPAIRPEAGALRIFVLDGPIGVGNQANFAGIMYGPRAQCGGSGSNAQADIYGSIICDVITNAGGWSFHFDDALLGIGSGEFVISEWREELPTPSP
jgi:hypothetical protein